MIRALNESKKELLAAAKKISILSKLSDSAIGKIINCYAKSNNLYLYQVEEEALIDELSEFDRLGDIIFTYFDDLSEKTVLELAQNDKKFEDAVNKVAMNYHFIDKDGNELIEIDGEAGDKASLEDLLNWIIYEIDDKKDRDDALKDISKEYNKITEDLEDLSVVKTANDEAEKEEASKEVEIPETELEPLEPVAVDYSVIQNAITNNINDIINSIWNMTSNINGLIGTIDLENNIDFNKDQVKDILNSVIDDSMVSVGMLQKAIMITDPKKADLLNSGEQKAENIVSDEIIPAENV